jgi:hypothetical protein
MGWFDRMRRMDPPEPEREPEPDWRSIAADAIEAQTEERRAFGVLHREVAAVSAGLATGLDPEGARMMLEGAFDRAAAARSADAECRDPVPERPPAGDPGWVGIDALRERVRLGLAAAGVRDTAGAAELVLREVFSPGDVPASEASGITRLIEANPRIEVDGPDLVSRMYDARTCLLDARDRNEQHMRRQVEGALRWLGEGIAEGQSWRAAMVLLYATLGDEDAHVCTCGHSPEHGIVGCSEGFGDRCRFELAIRNAVGR